MCEMPPQREIIVPGDMRATRGAKAAPRRAAAPRRDKPAPGELMATLGALARWLGGLCIHRPAETAGSLAAIGAAAYISINALGLQAGRHPAPILPQAKPDAVASAENRSAAQPSPVDTAAERAKERLAAAAPEKEPAHAAPRDGIGALIRSADETTASVTPKPEKAVMQAQRALSKLGYGKLKDDGVMGPGTKAAIEKFERDHKLPVKGEAAGRTLKELAGRAAKAKA